MRKGVGNVTVVALASAKQSAVTVSGLYSIESVTVLNHYIFAGMNSRRLFMSKSIVKFDPLL